MMDRTDRHFRRFLRVITKHTLLYTEMKTALAVIHGDRKRLLGFSEAEHPLALQLGGSDPLLLAEATRIATDLGFDEINLNVGCPSSRVKKGAFGACLMGEPDRVALCIDAMRSATCLPVTVKHRIGIDEIDTYQDMVRFVGIVADAGTDRFTVHARKAWLSGLNPKENRTIPPLRHPEVHRLKAEFPHLMIETNGGIKTHAEIARHLGHVDAVMVGRAAYETPYLFAEADTRYFGDDAPVLTRFEIAEQMLPVIEREEALGEKLHRITRHMLTLFVGQPGTKAWKQALSASENVGTGTQRVRAALDAVRRVQDETQASADSAPVT